MGSRAHIGVARLDTYGREAHAGSDHKNGISAVEELAHKILAIQGLTNPDRGVYVTIGEIQGGRRRSLVPGHASCTIDVRTPNPRVWDEVEATLQSIAQRVEVPGAYSEMRIHAHRPGVPWTTGTDRLIAVARRAGNAAGVSFEVVQSAAAGSSSFAGSGGLPTLDGMGPVGGSLMTYQEYVEIDTLPQRALLLALTLHYLSNEEA
jgi:glutamate carboxypeptidase